MRWASICQVVNGLLVIFGYIWMYSVYVSRCGQNAMKKEIDTSQALIAAHPFCFEWGTDNACYLHV